MGDHPPRPPSHRSLGKPLPYQPANGTHAHPFPPELYPPPHAGLRVHGVLIRLSAGYPPGVGRLHTRYAPVRRSPPVYCYTALPRDLHVLGLEAAAKRQVGTYSGGMKRRLNLIAGLLHSPKILFLDEPTVGVDVQSRNVIISHLTEVNAKGTTIIYTSHHMEEAEQFCTRVSIIDYGKILTVGTPAELIASVPGADTLEKVFLQLTKRKLRD